MLAVAVTSEWARYLVDRDAVRSSDYLSEPPVRMVGNQKLKPTVYLPSATQTCEDLVST